MTVDPNYKRIDTHVPEVSDSYVMHPFSPLRALSYIVVLLVVMLGILWSGFTVKTRLFSAHPPTSTISITPTPAVQIDCPNQEPFVPGQPPTLSFCSPEYGGNVAGPMGARIILVGENFPSSPTNWFLTKNSTTSLSELAPCSTNQLKGCRVLPSPAMSKLDQSPIYRFSWIWKAPFPEKPGNYFIIAQLGDQLVKSTVQFSLLASQAPCIAVAGVPDPKRPEKTEQKYDCTKPQTVSLKQNAALNLQGTNWLLGWDAKGVAPLNMQIDITARCQPKIQCTQANLFDIVVNSDQLNRDGTFSLFQPLPENVKGTYVVTARNKTNSTGEPGGKANTAADSALTFGESADMLILKIA